MISLSNLLNTAEKSLTSICSVFILSSIFAPSLLGKEKIGGLTLEAPPRPFTEEKFSEIESLNLNWVAVVPYAFMKSESPTVHYDPSAKGRWWGESLVGVETQIQSAQKRGLKVMLKPQVWIQRGFYTGKMKFKSEGEWEAFESSYRNYILTLLNSDICKKVDALCIGTEFDIAVHERPQFWKKLITECRQLFTGKLTYAANWDALEGTSFWGDLDAIGANAYFPINLKKPKKSWVKNLNQLKSLHEKYGKPVIFTEYGYRSVEKTTVEPWAEAGKRSPNLEQQKTALKLLYQEVWGKPWFNGGFLWKWKLRPAGGPKDRGYTVQDKPAAEVVAQVYKSFSKRENETE